MTVGNGASYTALAPSSVPFGTDLAADTQPPAPYTYGTFACWLRGSVANLPIGSNLLSDWLKAPGCLRALDEIVVTTLSANDIANLESQIAAVGVNDGAGPPSRVLLFLAGSPGSQYVPRILAAVAGNPKVELGVEGYHQGLLYPDYDQMRTEERAWLATLQARAFPMARAWYGFSAANAAQYAAENPAYDSATPRARDADEDACTEWMVAGVDKLFVWSPYASERSRIMAGDALARAIRRRYGIAP